MAAAAEVIAHPHLIRPEQPRNLKESGVSPRCLEGLILKTIKQEGAMTVEQLGERMLLPIHVYNEMVHSLHHREVLDTPAPMTYDLTNKGRELVHHYEMEDQYVGPAPVSFEAYCRMILRQAKRGRRLTQEEFNKKFEHLPARPELKRLLKEGFNAKEVMIFWGPPGNGKSMWSSALHSLMDEDVLVPYAFEYNGRCVKIYEPAFHKLNDEAMKQEEEATAAMMTTSGKPDRRWLVSRPPLVTVGTEFRVEHFQIAYDGTYDAPPHVKANNGIFVFDDLGRQTQDHNMILNQFIYPLEQHETIVKFAGGSSLRIPYQQRLLLSTNLNFRAIIDDAFSRRLLFQVLVDRPTDELFKQIFVRVESRKNGVDEAFAWILARKLLGWYKRDGRVIRASDSRDIYRMLNATLDEGQKLSDVLTVETFERVYSQYPVAREKDATGYKVERSNPDEFRMSLRKVLEQHEIDPTLTETLVEKSVDWMEAQSRLFRPPDAGNLLAIVDGEREEHQTIKDYLTEETFERVCRTYPMFLEADARRMEGTTGLAGK